MVTVICEKTGIQFEAKTARTKNHPAIMSLLNEAAKDGWYTKAMRVLSDGKELQLQSVEEFVNLMNQAKDQADAEYSARIRQRFQDKANRRERFILNGKLASHGYVWSKSGYSDIDSWEDNRPDSWELISSDNRTVTVAQALKEIGE